MTFFSKTVAESKDAAPGKRQEIYEGRKIEEALWVQSNNE